MKKKPNASDAQARFIARAWSDWRPVSVADINEYDATKRACVARGWLTPLGSGGHYPNGASYTDHTVSPDGLLALELYLAKRRYKA